MATTAATDLRVRWWVPGDWNAFFGLFTNVALNVIVLSGLVLGVIEMPLETVFGRILPALGIALLLGNLAGISLTFISMRPAYQSWEVPWIAFITLGLILMSWVAGARLPLNIPAGLVAVIIGTALAWIATLLNI